MAAYERGPGEQPTEAAYTAVADATDTDPLDLPPIADSVDPGALDSLVEQQGEDGDVCCTFEYAGCTVELTADAVDVTVDGADE